MDDPGSPVAMIFVLVLVLISAFFAMSESAFISLNDSKLRKEAEDGNKKAKAVMDIDENYEKKYRRISG